MIKLQQETINAMEPLKAMMVNVKNECDQKVLRLKQEERQDVKDLKNTNENLCKEILMLKSEIAKLQQEVEKCSEEVGEEYKKYRNESDARKLLIQDINDLKYQHEESRKNAGLTEAHGDPNIQEDPVMLRVALRKAREDLEKSNLKLAETLADYGDVVPRRDYEKLDAKYLKVQEGMDTLQNDYDILHQEHRSLLDIHKKMLTQNEALSAECETMRNCATPRPTWKKCGLYIEGGVERWNELTTDMTSSDKMELLLSEMTGYDLSVIKEGTTNVIEFFEPKGNVAELPIYLQSTERVRNRHLCKRDLCVLIKDVWREKIDKEGSKLFSADRSSMEEFFYEYLQKRFGLETMVTEWGYNTHDALLRYKYDRSVDIFEKVLSKQLDEDVYYMQLAILEHLYKILSSGDPNETGLISILSFKEGLQKYFSHYTSDEISELVSAARNELGVPEDDQLRYQDLFTEDDEGKTGPFIIQILKFFEEDKQTYMKELSSAMTNYNDLNVDDLRKVFEEVDKQISNSICDRYVRLAFNNDELLLSLKTKVAKNLILTNIESSCIVRSKMLPTIS